MLGLEEWERTLAKNSISLALTLAVTSNDSLVSLLPPVVHQTHTSYVSDGWWWQLYTMLSSVPKSAIDSRSLTFFLTVFFFFQGLNICIQTWNSLKLFQILDRVLCNHFTIFTVVACIPPQAAALISCFHSNDEVKGKMEWKLFWHMYMFF